MEIIDNSESIVPSEQLQEGFVPSSMPPPAPDGGPELEPAPLHLPILVESQCDRGPCRHRHRLTVAVDAAMPLRGGSLERPKLDEQGEPIIKGHEPDVMGWDGAMRPGLPVYETETYTPVNVTRVCYPAPGVKIELGEDEPIHECSLWDPEDPEDVEVVARERRRAAYAQRMGSADVEDLNREGDESLRTRGKK